GLGAGPAPELRLPARRRLLEQRDVPLLAREHLRELLAQRTVHLRVRRVRLGRPEQPRAPREERRVGRRVAAVEQVPAEHAHYDHRVPRHFLTGEELTSDELHSLIHRAIDLKADRLASAALSGASVALVFDRPSTRTRISFEVGVLELGGSPIVLRQGELQLSRGESVRDTALVLSRYVQLIALRTGAHATIEELARHSDVPVVNMLTEDHHPCQALADLVTLRERFGELEGLRLAYVGDGNNVAHSLMVLGPKVGVEVVVATPSELAPHPLVAQVGGAEAAAGGS